LYGRAERRPYNPRAVARYAPAALVAALLAATALAFAYTESLKLTPSPILGTRVPTKVFAPGCRCATARAIVSFHLRSTDDVTVDMVRGRDEVVRRLFSGQAFAGETLGVEWDGRDDVGDIVSEGIYRPRVKLARQHRTIVLPNPIRVDTTPPLVTMTRLAPRVFSPDGDRRRDRVVAGYSVDEPARVSLYIDGVRAVLKKGRKAEGTIDWFGTQDGKPLPKGLYRLRLAATDIAGNEGRPTRSKAVVIRYVALGRKQIEATPGSRIAVLVLSDASRVGWKLGRRAGTARPGTLRLRAPLQPGRFTLTVTANGRSTRAAVLVRSTAP
jgi:hypothetical protein